MKTRIRVEQSVNETTYTPEYFVDGWIFSGWESFYDIMGSSCGKPQKAWMRASKKFPTLSPEHSEQFAKQVIDEYFLMLSGEEKVKLHHKTKKTTYIDYP